MKTDKFIRVTFRQIDTSQEEFQQRLNGAFDLLFGEVERILEWELSNSVLFANQDNVMSSKEGVSALSYEAKKEVIGYAKN